MTDREARSAAVTDREARSAAVTDRDPAQTPYDRLPYHGLASLHSHPSHVAAVATLLGLAPAPVERCRVLELGSGTGGNLLGIAEDLPAAELLGIDLSARQVALSSAAAQSLGLRNVRFLHLDLLDFPVELGPFDYIIAHGLYSWVPAPVRDKILAICRDHLAPGGLAFVSYNALPGWSFAGILRELFLYHARNAAGTEARGEAVDEALELLALGAGRRSPPGLPVLQGYAKEYLRELQERGPLRDATLHHDLLGESTTAFYFHEFAAAAAAHGLQFVSEATPDVAPLGELPERSRGILLRSIRSAVELEQYLDFLHLRMFRQTLLCRAGRAVDRSVSAARLLPLHVGSRLRPVPDQQQRFAGPQGATVHAADPLSQAALGVLAQVWPATLPFAELLRRAGERLGPRGPAPPSPAGEVKQEAQELGELLMQAAYQAQDLVHLRAHAPPVCAAPGGLPVGRPLARLQAVGHHVVTNLYHENVSLPPLSRWVLHRLDGSRDRAALVEGLLGLVREGKLAVSAGSGEAMDPAELRGVLSGELEECLQALANQALLLG